VKGINHLHVVPGDLRGEEISSPFTRNFEECCFIEVPVEVGVFGRRDRGYREASVGGEDQGRDGRGRRKERRAAEGGAAERGGQRRMKLE
jgi:hypothetical protein